MSVDWEMEALLLMNGEVHDAGGGLWYQIKAQKVEQTTNRPHGIRYSLTLHDRDNTRIFGIDNAHRLEKPRKGPGYKRIIKFDHQHDGKKIKIYEYRSACDLLEDFFDRLDRELKKRKIK